MAQLIARQLCKQLNLEKELNIDRLDDFDRLFERGTLNKPLIYWFPRAGVGTHSGRASVQSVWVTRRWRVVKAFPRQRVGTRKRI
ncbi:hypothetical protein QUF54_07210 [Candidatus Marithioploca araucensis]|uniref:Uncharacterized protein n=1 Tax=Candidatus Marithioploca araucensis TaxID=70273 RepID=A0ABT7VUB1_9GAMM|nr:hypothetical protein [Candidatus Marithioploca araucensis]